jgi:formylglycine-generating enzyme required for sulfatase activity
MRSSEIVFILVIIAIGGHRAWKGSADEWGSFAEKTEPVKEPVKVTSRVGETVSGRSGKSYVVGSRIENFINGVAFNERVIDPVDGDGEPFLVMETEVTQKHYQAFMGKNPSHFNGLERPVEMVTWGDGVLFANMLSLSMMLQPVYDADGNFIEGANGFRYLLSPEWKWAARCGEEYKYAGSNDLDDIAWHPGNSGGQTHPVGLKQANACGLKDMTGNVAEKVVLRRRWMHRSYGMSFASDDYFTERPDDYGAKEEGLRFARALP